MKSRLLSAAKLGQELVGSDAPEKRTLAYLIGAYLIAAESTGEEVPAVIVIPDGEGSIGACGLTDNAEEALSLLLSGVCGLSIQALGLDLATVKQLLTASWGERTSGMGGAGRHGAVPRGARPTTRRPSTQRGRGKR